MSNQSDADTTPRDTLTEPQRAWVNALRSGKYKQAKHALALVNEGGEPVGLCCLGVACEVAREHGIALSVNSTHVAIPGTDERVRARTYDAHAVDLPPKVKRWLGLDDECGSYRGSEIARALTEDNDEGATFAQIADTIEDKPAGLFVEPS